MKKITALLGFFFLINLGQSCIADHYLITDISFSLADIEKNEHKDKQNIHYTCTSFVKERLIFIISYQKEYISQNLSHGFGSVCYATSRPIKIDNPLIEESFSLDFDKPFLYENIEIPQRTNVFGIGPISKEIDMYKNFMVFCSNGADKVIEFSQTFWENASFEKGEYEVSFSCSTSNGINFKKKIRINFV